MGPMAEAAAWGTPRRSEGPHPADPLDPAHLTSAERPSPPIHRYAPSPGLAPLVMRYWVPVWDLPEGVTWTQQVLQYPVCLVVVSTTYAIAVGPDTGLGRVDLAGSGWAVGTMLRPAAGRWLVGGPVSGFTDRRVDLGEVAGLDPAALVAEVRATMEPDPPDPDRHVRAIRAVESRLRRLAPVDADGRLCNDLLDLLEARPGLVHVRELCEALGRSERTLQRLTLDRMGLTPKWLIQRRRLHDATLGIKQGRRDLATVAVESGYADQAHFTRDFKRFTGMTPGAYLRAQPGPR